MTNLTVFVTNYIVSTIAMQVEPIPVVQTSSFGVYLGLGLAVATLVQVITLALINGWFGSRKEERDAERAIVAAKAAAEIKAAEVKEAAEIRSKEKQEEWRRQDAVADQAAEAARLLLEAQRETIVRTDQVAKLTEDYTKKTTEKLEQIHILVNSEMTTARKAERDTQELLVMALKHSMLLGKNQGIDPTKEERDALAVAEQRIIKLNKIIKERDEAQAKIDEELKQAGILLTRRAEDMKKKTADDITLKKIEVNTAATVKALESTAEILKDATKTDAA